MPDPGETLMVEIDGPGVHPNTVDGASALELAASFVGLVRKLAADRDQTLVFSGVEILDKCMAVAVHVDQRVVARELSQEALRLVRAPTDAPRGTAQYIERVRTAIRHLPEGQKARVIVAQWGDSIEMETTVSTSPPWGRLSQRVKLLRIGGTRPLARIQSRYESDDFSLAVTVDQARDLAVHLYQSIDIEARVARDAEGVIERGELVAWHPISTQDANTAWRDWFRDHAVSERDGKLGNHGSD